MICKFYAFDQPIREPLLGDRLACDSPTIGDEELGSAVLSVVAGASHILIESPADTESALGTICGIVHCWHKDGPQLIGLGIGLR